MTANARFWIWWNNSWIKLTLRPGQSVSMGKGGPNDEGFCCESQGYQHDGDRVSSYVRIDSRDCDGPHTYDWDGFCLLADLKAAEADEYGPARPTWTKESSFQRDLYAELSGY